MSKNYIKEFLEDNGLDFDQWFKIEQYRDMEDMSFKINTNGRLECSNIEFFNTEGLDNILRDLLIGDEDVITLGDTIARAVNATVNVAYDICEVSRATTNTKGRIAFKKGKEPIEFTSYVSDKEYDVYTALGEILLGKVVLR